MENLENNPYNSTESSYQKASLPEWVEMYEISGQDSITEHSFNRYKKDKEQDLAIQEVAKKTF